MDLKTYRTKNGIKMPDMAKALKKTPQHLYEIERGIAFPSRKLAQEIESQTEGNVTAIELLGIESGMKEQAGAEPEPPVSPG